jgi:hypothetical protein
VEGIFYAILPTSIFFKSNFGYAGSLEILCKFETCLSILSENTENFEFQIFENLNFKCLWKRKRLK